MSDIAGFADSLSRVARHWRTRLNARFRELDLTQARWLTLLELSNADGVNQRDLALTLGIEAPTLVRLLDGLEGQGLIVREACTADRRAKLVRLTPAAQPLLDKMHAIADALRADLLRDIPEDQLLIAAQVLTLIAERLETTSHD